jgi:hypothetical protein
MITFIPRKGKGNGHAGVVAGAQALLVAFVGIPYYFYCKIRGK